MAIYRTKDEADFKTYGTHREDHVTIPEEWGENNGSDRVDDPSWMQRYEYEASLIGGIISDNGYKKILEIGSGPGVLGQLVQKNHPTVEYHFIDKPNAEAQFVRREHKGSFFVKDLMNEFDIAELHTDYDMVVTNDFLEHIANPSDVLYKCREITKPDSTLFVSVPNWRMGHTFIYRGLFDYDNYLYFSMVHGWNPESVAGSPLKCAALPRQSSEDMLSDELLNSWNWYFVSKKAE